VNIRSLLPSADIDALLGDITEESRHRSRLWYAAQIVAVVVVGSWRDVRRHPLLALRAVAVGVASFIAFVSLTFGLVLGQVGQLTSSIKNAWFRSIDREQLGKFDTALFFATSTLMFYVALGASGWLVGRVNRKHGIALVLPFAALAAHVLRPTAWHGDQIVMSGLWWGFVKSLAAGISVLIGGYLATRSRLVTRDS
jgi:hypothetical protein